MQNTFLAQKISANADTIGRLEMRIEDLKGQLHTQSEDIKTAVQLLQSWVHDHGPLNETINFVQAYWNKHNIFPYEP